MSLPSVQTAAIIRECHANPTECFVIDLQYPLPTLEDNDVLVKNYSAGVNPLDCAMRVSGRFISSFPAILGVDYSGIVCAVGSHVTKFKVGDSVSGCTFGGFRGTYSQYVVSSESQTAHNPSDVSHQVASSGGVTFLTAFQSFLQHPSSKSGQKGSFQGKKLLLIGGSGGVGLSAILLAKHYFNAEQIIVISSGKNSELVSMLGVDQVLDYTKGNDSIRSELEKLNGYFDLVVDLVGGYQDFYDIEILKKDQEAIFVSIVRSIPVSGKVFGSDRSFALFASPIGEQYERILEWLAETQLWKKIPLSIFPLEKVAQAHQMSETKRTVGKIILEIPQN